MAMAIGTIANLDMHVISWLSFSIERHQLSKFSHPFWPPFLFINSYALPFFFRSFSIFGLYSSTPTPPQLLLVIHLESVHPFLPRYIVRHNNPRITFAIKFMRIYCISVYLLLRALISFFFCVFSIYVDLISVWSVLIHLLITLINVQNQQWR